MKVKYGDTIKVKATEHNDVRLTTDEEEGEGGEGCLTNFYISPKKARRLAHKLLAAAAQAEVDE